MPFSFFCVLDVSFQLSAAQSRCSLLEKQLDYMREMVSSAELEKKLVLEQQVQSFIFFIFCLLHLLLYVEKAVP